MTHDPTRPVGTDNPVHVKEVEQTYTRAPYIKTHTDWYARWLHLALHFSSWSKDPSTKVGAVLVKEGQLVSSGYNGFPKGVKDDPDMLNNRETKYQWTVHAEMNAILQAAFHGHPTKGTALFTSQAPCMRCSTAIIQAGIQVVVFDDTYPLPERWHEDARVALSMLRDAGVSVIGYVLDAAAYEESRMPDDQHPTGPSFDHVARN